MVTSAVSWRFAHPQLAVGLVVILVLASLWWFRKRATLALPFSSFMAPALLATPKAGFWQVFAHLGPLLRVLCFFFLALGAARPQLILQGGDDTTRALSIVLVLDTSGSMRERDLDRRGGKFSRLDVVKDVVDAFIDSRKQDRLALVTFGTYALVLSPLTFDHAMVKETLHALEIGIAGEATAIGDGLGLALKRFQEGGEGQKVVVLLTDGANTAGRLDPRTAAGIAKDMGIKVYTIAIGGQAGRGRSNEMSIDVDLLEEIASTTGGNFFLGNDRDSLQKIYAAIDQQEKPPTKISEPLVLKEFYVYLAGLAFLCFMLELCFSLTPLKRMPL